MIGIGEFGWRLGNQLFQLATAIAAAQDRDGKIIFPDWQYAKYFKGDFTPSEQTFQGFLWREKGFHYTPIPATYKNLVLCGYFQSEKYFAHHADYIREQFALKDNIKKDAIGRATKELNESTIYRDFNNDVIHTATLHVRRGDYLGLPNHHPVLTINWYHRALTQIPQSEVFICSDDPGWCEKELVPRLKLSSAFRHSYHVTRQSDIEDFALMTTVNANIIANSSFSWWAAWLNNRQVIAPNPHTNWFGPALSHHNMDDLIPAGWVTI